MIDEKHPIGSKENDTLRRLVKQYLVVFATEDEPLSVTPFFVSSIKQQEEVVVYRRPYNIPICFHDAVHKQLQTLQQQGIIRPSKSPVCAPLIPVPK